MKIWIGGASLFSKKLTMHNYVIADDFLNYTSRLCTLICFPHTQKFPAVVPCDLSLCLLLFCVCCEFLCQQELASVATTRWHY